MRTILFIGLTFLLVKTSAQKCDPNTTVRAIMCPNWWDSASICYNCSHCVKGIMASDTFYSVVGFKMTLQTTDGDLPVRKETEVSGHIFPGYARKLLLESKNGDTISFTCIKAKNRVGNIFVLQPIMFEVKF